MPLNCLKIDIKGCSLVDILQNGRKLNSDDSILFILGKNDSKEQVLTQ